MQPVKQLKNTISGSGVLWLMGVYFAPPNSSFGHVDVLGRLLERAFVNVSHAAHLCAVLPGQYRSTAGSTAQKLILHSGCWSCFLYMTELDPLTVWSQNRDALVVQRLTLRSVSKGELGRFPWGPCWWLFSFFFCWIFCRINRFFWTMCFFRPLFTTR